MKNTAVKEKDKSVCQSMLSEVLEGLSKPQKSLPSKYFYDKKGSELFEQICQLEEYYPTRTELSILEQNVDEISDKIGKHVRLIELGSGSSLKTRLILDNIDSIDSYVPVDISKDFLADIVQDLQEEYPGLKIQPVAADYTEPFDIPGSGDSGKRRIAYYPGSTIGNFTKDRAEGFIGLISKLVDKQGGLLVGFDLIKDRTTLINAYDDSKGITAAFNKNILKRINRELSADFDVDLFEHKALFNDAKSRIEMHLVSKKDQKITIAGREFAFDEGESIHTENSHKYSLESFRNMTKPYFEHVTSWTDSENKFCVQFLTNTSVKSLR
ncbi:L-histidine N(alpha)-methyltransferase [Gracilimonas sp. Q87]|uniref:L-histidine N(alpha)-methyltransferase n=1 Tax=Gracilimonas sp. Q87 TaxID=3384766 RepID=UPI003983E6C9